MGTKERRERQLQAREQLLLSKARELIVRDGLLNLQMARLAEESEHAMGTLYQHFSSKEDLLLALTTESVVEQAELFRRAAEWQASTRERMFAITVADTIFVNRCPEHFRIAQYALCEVVWNAASARRREAYHQASQPLCNSVLSIVNQAIADADLDPRGLSPEAVATGCWTMALGFHTLVHADGMLEYYNVHHPYHLLCRHMQSLLNGMGWQPLVDPADDAALDDLISRIRTEVFHELCPNTR